MQENVIRNLGALTKEEQCILHTKKVFICGCGGLGGFSVEFLARLGIGNIIVCDSDIFDESNLNRQILCTTETLNKSKAQTAKSRILSINPNINVSVVNCQIDKNNAVDLIKGSDLVIDALDSIESRYIVEKACTQLNIPFIYGAVDRFYGQVSTIYPNDNSLEKIYKGKKTQLTPSVLSFTVAMVSAFQASEAVKVLLNKPTLKNKLLLIDLFDNSLNIMSL